MTDGHTEEEPLKRPLLALLADCGARHGCRSRQAPRPLPPRDTGRHWARQAGGHKMALGRAVLRRGRVLGQLM